jgi:tetrapyrrole methylase family protein / MazG family protein
MTIHIVGLGPGSASHLTAGARTVLESGLPVVLRTRHHPVVSEVDSERRFTDCDDLYGAGAAFEEVYSRICDRLIASATESDLVYAVPGNPLLAERSVEMLLERAEAEGIETRFVPGLSYVDVAATALKRDLAQLQLCDALDLRIDAQRPALISQLHDRDAVSRLKLDLLDRYPPEHAVVVLHELGLPSEEHFDMALSELDRRPYGYLDLLYVPELDPAEDVRSFDGMFQVVARLNAPDGCPWDREQTHASLRKHLLEETYEALDALDSGSPEEIAEELGDLLLQVLMHAEVGRREDTFSFGDITEQITRKLIRRHPHVFGKAKAESAEDVWQSWEQLKKQEKPEGSILDGVPKTLPALAASQAIQGRARRVGFDWPDIEGPLDKLSEEIGELARAKDASERIDEFGDVLFVVANIGQRLGIDAEGALREANQKFRRRFSQMEALAQSRRLDMQEMDLEALDALWNEAKAELEGKPL